MFTNAHRAVIPTTSLGTVASVTNRRPIHLTRSGRCLASVALTAAVPALVLSSSATSKAAPPCSQWGFDGSTSFHQSNNWNMDFNSTGPRAQGAATAYNVGASGLMNGTISGSIDGYAVNLEVRWDGGSLGKYQGSVDANGFASGNTYDAKNPSSSAGWNSDGALRCMTPAPS